MRMKLRYTLPLLLFPCVALAQPYNSVWDGTDKLAVNADGSINATCNAGTNLNTSTLATATKQDTGNTSLSSIDGKITACNTGAVVISSGSTTVTQGTATNLKAQCEAYQGGSAVASGNPLQVTLANGSVPSHAVTNAGTFAVQESGSALTALQLIDDAVATAGSAITAKGTAAAGTDGTNARILKTDSSGELQVDVLTMPTTTVTAAGDVAHDTADSGNPVKVGGKAVNTLPTAVANADRANLVTDLFGRLLTGTIDPAMAVHKSVNVTTTQTGSDVWSPTSGKKIAVTSVIVSSYGTTGCRALLWFGDNADTTYSAGTDQLLVPFSTVPSATIKPGIVYQPPTPVFCTTADRELHLTTDAGCSLDIVVEGYEF